MFQAIQTIVIIIVVVVVVIIIINRETRVGQQVVKTT
jgi:hypothetical protein